MLRYPYLHHLLTEYEVFLTNFAVYTSGPTQSIIVCNFRKIRVDLSDYWSFYGLKLPLKYSFSLYKFYLKSSNSLTTWHFLKTLVFLYSQFIRAMIHIVEKTVKKFSSSRNGNLRPLPPNFRFFHKFRKLSITNA